MAISISSSSPNTNVVSVSSGSTATVAPQAPPNRRQAIMSALQQAAQAGNPQAAQLLQKLASLHKQMHAYKAQGQQPPPELRQANQQLFAAASQLTGLPPPIPPQAQSTAVAAYNGVSSFGR